MPQPDHVLSLGEWLVRLATVGNQYLAPLNAAIGELALTAGVTTTAAVVFWIGVVLLSLLMFSAEVSRDVDYRRCRRWSWAALALLFPHPLLRWQLSESLFLASGIACCAIPLVYADIVEHQVPDRMVVPTIIAVFAASASLALLHEVDPAEAAVASIAGMFISGGIASIASRVELALFTYPRNIHYSYPRGGARYAAAIGAALGPAWGPVAVLIHPVVVWLNDNLLFISQGRWGYRGSVAISPPLTIAMLGAVFVAGRASQHGLRLWEYRELPITVAWQPQWLLAALIFAITAWVIQSALRGKRVVFESVRLVTLEESHERYVHPETYFRAHLEELLQVNWFTGSRSSRYAQLARAIGRQGNEVTAMISGASPFDRDVLAKLEEVLRMPGVFPVATARRLMLIAAGLSGGCISLVVARFSLLLAPVGIPLAIWLLAGGTNGGKRWTLA